MPGATVEDQQRAFPGAPETPQLLKTAGMDKLFGGVFGGLNRVFRRSASADGCGVGGVLCRKTVPLIVHGLLLALTAFMFIRTPSGLVPAPDK